MINAKIWKDAKYRRNKIKSGRNQSKVKKISSGEKEPIPVDAIHINGHIISDRRFVDPGDNFYSQLVSVASSSSRSKNRGAGLIDV